MNHPLPWLAAAMSAALLAAVPHPAAAAGSSALVLAVSGSTEPSVAPYSELGTGETVTLGAGVTLRAVHYKSCRILTLTGGMLQAGPEDFSVRGGSVAGNSQGRCPQRVVTTGPAGGDGGIGGLLLRGTGTAPVAVSPGEVFVFAGPGAAKLARVRLTRAQRTLAKWAPGPARTWRLPDGALAIGEDAVLEIEQSGRTPPVTQTVKMLRPVGEGEAARLMVIELD